MKAHNLLRILLLVAAAASFILTTALAPITSLTSSNITRIRFARGATSAVVSGNLPANATARYVLRAGVGQLMDVSLSAPEGVSLKVTASGGRALTPIKGTSGPTGFRGYLPRTGDYTLAVASGSQAVSFSLNVFIPQRIRFDRGATSATLEGHLDAHQGLDYILHARDGQILEINVTPETADIPLQLIIYGVDGTVLRSGMGEGSSFRGVLPENQDYLISVRAADKAADFSMVVIVPQRIRFITGATSASVFTRLPAYHTQYYSLHALEGQTMQVKITPGSSLQLIIYGVDGTVLKSGMGEGSNFSGELPSTQDFILAVKTAARWVSYRLRVTIK